MTHARLSGTVSTLALLLGFVTQAAAQTPTTPTAAPAEKPAANATAETPAGPPPTWQSTIKFNAQFEGGIDFNPSGPKTNFGQLFTDHPNQLQLNQSLLTVSRTIDPKETGWDVGFKLQGLYGSDARYTHFTGFLDKVTKDRYQFDVVEANVTVHAPILTEGGLDLKAGMFSTPLGSETIDPSTNPFYSHSYIFNFGIPFKHTGVLATLHATSVIDAYAGITSGVNTAPFEADNNTSAAALFGFGLNLLDGNLTVLALSHIGPESASRAVPHADGYNRYLNDVVVTWKVDDKLTLTSEFNYIRDDFARAEGYGLAQYASYAVSDQITLNARGELWRDNKGFFVGSYPGNLDAINAQEGRPATVLGAAPTTYGELTVGFTYKPTLPEPIAATLIRPEIRYDRSLNGSKPFNGGRDNGSFTLGADIVIGF